MLLGGVTGQVVAIVLGVLAGLRLCRTTTAASASAPSFPISRRAGAGALLLFLLLAGLPLASMATGLHCVALLDVFYRTGASFSEAVTSFCPDTMIVVSTPHRANSAEYDTAKASIAALAAK